MGMLLNRATGERIVLRANHVFGRNASRSDTYLSDPEVSLLHAAVRWSDGRWLIADHSRNGTRLNDRPLAKGVWVPIAEGQVLRFGSSTASVWRVLDLSPPCTVLLPLDAVGSMIRLARNNILPNDDEPQLSIYQDDAGLWLLDSQGEVRKLHDGDSVSLDGRDYRFIVHSDLDETMGVPRPRSAEPPWLTFRLSLDEEHTQLGIQYGAQQADLGERSHHYCLATLARQRLTDAQSGFDPEAQGWVSVGDLAKMLGMDVPHVNIQIFRARNQVMSAMPEVPQLANIIERRRGEVRLGDFAFMVQRGSQQEGLYEPGIQYKKAVDLT